MGTGTVPPAALLLLLGMVGGTEALSKWRVFETRHVVGDVETATRALGSGRASASRVESVEA